jgi:hypothetical protein
MKSRIHIAFLSITVLLLVRCTKPFDAESFGFDRVLVVDGQITDELKQHQVTLSYTYPIGEEAKSTLNNAEVWVEDGDGGRVDYSETDPGVYQTDVSFSGVVGQTYQLFFTTPEGKKYHSNSIELLKSPPIDSIYDQYARLTTDESTSALDGIQFFIDTHDETNKAKYFRYDWEETYQIRTPYPSYYIYFEPEDSIANREIPVHVCYNSNKSSSIIVGNTLGSVESRLAEMPVRFISNQVDFLRSRYSILVRQYAINESSFSFYRKLKESNESGGSLFDKQQGTITGNIRSIDDPDETILGYFEVAGVSLKRAFFSFSDLDREFPRPDFRYACNYNDLIDTTRDSIAQYAAGSAYLITQIYETPTEPIEERYVLAYRLCADCSSYASLVVPEFWTEN